MSFGHLLSQDDLFDLQIGLAMSMVGLDTLSQGMLRLPFSLHFQASLPSGRRHTKVPKFFIISSFLASNRRDEALRCSLAGLS